MPEHVDDLLSAYIDNELTASEKRQVEEHLFECTQCLELLNDLREIQGQTFAVYQAVLVPERLNEKVMDAIDKAVTADASRHGYWLIVPIIAVLGLMGMAFVLVGSYIFNFVSVIFRVVPNLLYALGTVLASEPLTLAGLVGFSLLLIIASSISLRFLLKTKAV